ncbi:Hypothetical predicted protein [Mytilus galloprovincialis]|uniref:Uncharacterized protein n=1 Tax=Mytilus galloprovincialis TaxID=29158 RepID=A0A8B6DMG6_MYTGA|nr:Hypothetical predicted protein [Mytilus galloprovincialis]
MGNCNCRKKQIIDEKEDTGNALQGETNGDDNLKDDAYGKLVTWIIDMADTDCTGKELMQDMLDGETVLHNTGTDSDTSRSLNLSSQQASIDSVGSGSENMSWKSSISPDSRSICTIPETRYLGRAQSEDIESVRPKQRGVFLKQISVACDSRTAPKALNRDKSLEFSKPKELNKSLDLHKSSEISKSMKSLKSPRDVKDIEPNLKMKETELLKARYQNIMSKKEQNTLIKQSSEPESFRNKLQPRQKLDVGTKSFDNFLDVPKPFSPTYTRQSSDESSSSKKDYLSTSSKSFDSDSARCISTSPRAKGKRTISDEGFRKKEKYRMSIRNKPVKSFDIFLDDSVKSSKNSMSRQTTISIEDEDGVIIENIHQDSDEEMIPLRPLSVESDNAGKFDVSFESSKNQQNKRTPLGILSRSLGNIKEKTSKLKSLVRRKSSSLMTIKASENEDDKTEAMKAVSNEEVILNDTLLDGNINDILFAIDTLWPTK